MAESNSDTGDPQAHETMIETSMRNLIVDGIKLRLFDSICGFLIPVIQFIYFELAY